MGKDFLNKDAYLAIKDNAPRETLGVVEVLHNTARLQGKGVVAEVLHNTVGLQG